MYTDGRLRQLAKPLVIIKLMRNSLLSALLFISIFACTPIENDSNQIHVFKDENGNLSGVEIIPQKTSKHSLKLTFHPNGELKELKEYSNEINEGKEYKWRLNGNFFIESKRTNSKYDGVLREVFPNGRTAFEGERVGLKYEGITNSFYKTGAIKMRLMRWNDKDSGQVIKYFENGRIMEIGENTDSGYKILSSWNEKGEKIK